MSAKTFQYDQLKESAQGWAIEQVNEKHPIGTRDKNLYDLAMQYDYNRHGDIVDYSEEKFEGQDPEYYDDILGG